jgi:hypothetical protein
MFAKLVRIAAILGISILNNETKKVSIISSTI